MPAALFDLGGGGVEPLLEAELHGVFGGLASVQRERLVVLLVASCELVVGSGSILLGCGHHVLVGSTQLTVFLGRCSLLVGRAHDHMVGGSRADCAVCDSRTDFRVGHGVVYGGLGGSQGETIIPPALRRRLVDLAVGRILYFSVSIL